MANIIKESYIEKTETHCLKFSWRTASDSGYCFNCNKDGSLTQETLDNAVAMENYKYALENSVGENGDMISNGVQTDSYVYRVPATIECSRCGKEHHLGEGSYPDSQCSCGKNYNAFGQELRDDYNDPSTYAETGEDYYGEDYDY